MSLLKVLSAAIAGAIVFGLIGIKACQYTSPTPKFCGLMAFYTAPIGFVIGAIGGLVWESKGKK